MTFKRTYERWGFKDGEEKLRIGTGGCDGLITCPEESYRLWRILVCDLGTCRMRRLKLIKGCKCRIEGTCGGK
jgi:hypothetical protein